MKISLHRAGRRFGGEPVFRELSLELAPGQRCAVLGGNGSGKSTLLKILYGALSLSDGRLQHSENGKNLNPDEAARRLSFSGPYFELIEELPAAEFLDLFQKVAPLRHGESTVGLLAKAQLCAAAQKPIAQYSSGMKQRLRLALALLRDSAGVLLDEPTANLDPEGVAWYRRFLEAEIGNRLLLVGSNYNPDEKFLCNSEISLLDYK